MGFAYNFSVAPSEPGPESVEFAHRQAAEEILSWKTNHSHFFLQAFMGISLVVLIPTGSF